MRAIVDNDVAKKLARYGLLPTFEGMMRRQRRTIELQPLIDGTFDLQKRWPIAKLGPAKLVTEAQRDALIDCAKRCGRVALDPACGQRLVKTCALVDGIDSGDSVWLAAGACDPSAIVYTHDKNALRGVVSSHACAEIVTKLAGRVVCLEQLMLTLMADVGYHVVRNAVLTDVSADESITGAFAGPHATSALATQTLQQKIASLRDQSGPLLTK